VGWGENIPTYYPVKCGFQDRLLEFLPKPVIALSQYNFQMLGRGHSWKIDGFARVLIFRAHKAKHAI
jgi:hypothetical protein